MMDENWATSFRDLSDLTLETEIKFLVQRERELSVEVLHHLREVEVRKIHLRRGYASLFEYCTVELKYSDGAAGRRIAAMRLLKTMPEISEKMESGSLSLSNVASVANFLRREERLKGKPVTPEEKLDLLAQVENKSREECEKVLIARTPEAAIPRELERLVTENLTEIRFVADAELIAKFKRLKSVLGHSLVEHTYAELFAKLADEVLKRKDPKFEARDAVAARSSIREENSAGEVEGAESKSTPLEKLKRPKITPHPQKESFATEVGSRHIPIATRRAIWERDGGCCQHRDVRTGKICGSTYRLEIDHIIPFSQGGDHELDNLELVCRNHNLLRAGDVLGEEFMSRYA